MLTEVRKVGMFQQKRRRGDVTKVATLTGYSISHTSNVLGGRRINSSITSTAYRRSRNRVPNLKLLDA